MITYPRFLLLIHKAERNEEKTPTGLRISPNNERSWMRLTHSVSFGYIPRVGQPTQMPGDRWSAPSRLISGIVDLQCRAGILCECKR